VTTNKRKKFLSCEECEGLCCRYIAVQIDKPTSKNDYDNIRWMLYHENTHICIDHEGDWVLQVYTPCTQLDPKTRRCKIYNNRPLICKKLRLEECEWHGADDDAEITFHNAEDFDRWLSGRKKKRKK